MKRAWNTFLNKMTLFLLIKIALGELVSLEIRDNILYTVLDKNVPPNFEMDQINPHIIFNSSTKDLEKVEIHFSSTHYPDIEAWTYIPLMARLESHLADWFIFLETVTRIDRIELSRFLEGKNASKPYFFGSGMKDLEPTIRHHFDATQTGRQIIYPDIRSGFILSKASVHRIASTWAENRAFADFSIDAAYELAKYAANIGIKMQGSDIFCDEQVTGCLSWFSAKTDCQKVSTTSLESIHFAVKTCTKLGPERIPILQNTWLPEASNVALYSDKTDVSLNTISLGIPNTDRGHCGKTMAIIQHVATTLSDISWLVIVDDDTLISPKRLTSYLQCFSPSEILAIGERYGFQATTGHGINYITGGGGIVLSLPLMQRLIEPGACVCPSNDTPDDMFLGSCLQRLRVPIIHSTRFHQARPQDYPEQLIKDTLPISFHKFWMVNPRKVYSTWLKDKKTHTEL